MGIEDLWQILIEKQCGSDIPISQLKNLIKTDGCRVAIDSFLLFHKHFSVWWGKAFERNASRSTKNSFSYEWIFQNVIEKLMNFSNSLTRAGIEQVWCLDGTHSDAKLATLRRETQRQIRMMKPLLIFKHCTEVIQADPSKYVSEGEALSPFSFLSDQLYIIEALVAKGYALVEIEKSKPVGELIEEMKEYLRKYPVRPRNFTDRIATSLKEQGVQFLRVPSISEGEKLCSILIQAGYCQAVVSSDGDTLPMGARCIIKQIDFERGSATVYSYTETLQKLEMTHKQFLSLCILLGNDFNNGIKDIGPVKSLKEVMKEGFDIYEFDKLHCGVLNVNECIEAFTVSKEEYEAVVKAIENI